MDDFIIRLAEPGDLDGIMEIMEEAKDDPAHHAAADGRGVEGLHGIEVAVFAVVGRLVCDVDEVAGGLDGVCIEACNHRPAFLVVQASP